MSAPAVSYGVRDARVRRGPVSALDGVSVTAARGRITAVVGGDGAGKTTLLRALVGQVRLDAGTVSAPPPQRIGYLPASTGSWLELSVQENVDFVGGVYGLTRAQVRARSAELLEPIGLAAVRDRLSAQLSGGMRRKLGCCLAMLHRPDLLVLDEPSTGVDPVSRVDLWRLVSQAAAAGAAVLLSTTYLDEAERAAHLVALNGGRALVVGAPSAVVAGFAGTVVAVDRPTRPAWAWRRGRGWHEWWPAGASAGPGTPVVPDLEDVIVVASLQRPAHRSPR